MNQSLVAREFEFDSLRQRVFSFRGSLISPLRAAANSCRRRATSHFLAMCSFHTPDIPCAGCLHPCDDSNSDPLPTSAFISFAAGLMMASCYLSHLGVGCLSLMDQQRIFYPLRPER